MNLDSVTTPADLVSQNQQPPATVDSVYSQLLELYAPQALEVLKQAVSQLAQWHQSESANSEDCDRARAWAVDEGRLHVALLALNEVSF